MKIGFDAKRIYHNTTGLGNYGRDLIKILSEYYPSNSYLLYNPKPKKVDRLPNKLNIIEILPNKKIWKLFSSFWRQKPIINQLKYDNIDIFHGLTGELPNGIEKTSIKSVVTIHDLIFIRYPKLYSFFDRIIHTKKVQYAAENADKIIAISEQTKSDIIHFLKIDSSKIEVIYQGCHETFKVEKSIEFRKFVKQKYNLPVQFILNVGAINERKNILTLIKSIENIETKLIIVGVKTSYYKVLNNYINENNLQKKVFFLENVTMDELSAIYQMATIFVYPSIFEGFGIPIIEALFSKTPVITSTGSCFFEAGGPQSIYVDPKDFNTISKKISLVLENKELRNLMIDEGFQFVQKFNDDLIAIKYNRVYLEL
ncbi:MAG: glycosyltransferase family 4 protein [Flavobacteriia bacterium]|nr:glycosyltransferase family 4 protein [Flavobacteriia bacterium]OIP47997.1 MAG: glycosyl transferase family 1 [Flavobacteriaceae bacterium CG2_30_31_66]PIV96154.1 MAG: glycosyl transferase family 1 [Flavobacteriaceae bacterium CG17_big_fil_post_rev_8_21_14_2_50_31_13]PIX12990.1 MAG: glycosyl transferase family 1 [Flavobacteriaceae bacterium CG_4_8_14_3_um_filter_31_8]PIY14371.1 MAG: glycosyl transferase family 1 [Flavobacteriaceae bacterium CG_4_10_14_3_um_filter_31_253]PIZ10458.1 MAG: glyco